ncbi:MAG: RnfABCDGE type electron transport complex subunit G [Oscillospiraceae bacterium]|nr:RnfABCDGE type electron transport complex subunit G [Oscillospiraceae bacterium]
MKFSAKSIIIPTISLFIIALVVAAALAGTNMVTAEKIKEVELANEQASCYAVLNLDENDSNNQFGDKQTISVNGSDYNYYVAQTSGKDVGYAFITTGSGYGGKIKIVTGVDLEGTVTGIYTLDISNETPGLGQNASQDKFKGQFTGIKASDGEVKVSKDGGTIEAMSGATITSRAVSSAVDTALKAYNQIKGAA